MSERQPQKFDLHGHTKYGFPPEGITYSPKDALARAKEIGLMGIAITGHNTMRGLRNALDKAEGLSMILIPGVELTSYMKGRTPHILALGIDPVSVPQSIFALPVGRSPQYTIKWIHDHNGLAVAVHPSETPKLTSLTPADIRKLGQLLDAIEVTTLSGGHNKSHNTLADEIELAAIGGSDFHLLDQIGLAGTLIQQKVTTWQDVINAIREHDCTTFVQDNISPDLRIARSKHWPINTLLRLLK